MKSDIWTAESINVLREMAEHGYSFKDIAAALGQRFTKNACVGKSRRLGIKWNCCGPPPEEPPMMARKPQPIVVYTPRSKRDEPEVFVPLATIETVTDAQCKFPLGDATAHMPVCGRARFAPHRYCEPHFAVSRNRQS